MSLNPVTINGQPAFQGLVQFVDCGFFGPARDSEGNEYTFKGGVLGLSIVRSSIKLKEKAGVIAIKKGEKQFEIAKWY